MMEIDGIPPRLAGQVCEGLLCQEYCYLGRRQQEVDALFIKVNGRWHQLYFDSGIVFWRQMTEAPVAAATQPGDLFSYPLHDVAARYGLEGVMIEAFASEALLDGAEVRLAFAGRGELIVRHIENRSGLYFIAGASAAPAGDEEE